MSPFYTTINIDFALMADQLVGLCLQEFGELGIKKPLSILNVHLLFNHIRSVYQSH